MLAENQETFRSCYRNRHHAIFHLAYLRLSKVRMIERLLHVAGISLDGKAVLDFGFGAGSFLRTCPPTAQLYGVELDPETIREVEAALKKRNFRSVDLRPCNSTFDLAVIWPENFFDVIVCSHVLEHVDDPAPFLEGLGSRLNPGGRLICLVPLNELVRDPKHHQIFNHASLEAVCRTAGLDPICYLEDDFWLYWLQPFFLRSGKIHRIAAQFLSLSLGILTCSLGWRLWSFLGRWFAACTFSKPTQASVVLERR